MEIKGLLMDFDLMTPDSDSISINPYNISDFIDNEEIPLENIKEKRIGIFSKKDVMELYTSDGKFKIIFSKLSDNSILQKVYYNGEKKSVYKTIYRKDEIRFYNPKTKKIREFLIKKSSSQSKSSLASKVECDAENVKLKQFYEFTSSEISEISSSVSRYLTKDSIKPYYKFDKTKKSILVSSPRPDSNENFEISDLEDFIMSSSNEEIENAKKILAQILVERIKNKQLNMDINLTKTFIKLFLSENENKKVLVHLNEKDFNDTESLRRACNFSENDNCDYKIVLAENIAENHGFIIVVPKDPNLKCLTFDYGGIVSLYGLKARSPEDPTPSGENYWGQWTEKNKNKGLHEGLAKDTVNVVLNLQNNGSCPIFAITTALYLVKNYDNYNEILEKSGIKINPDGKIEYDTSNSYLSYQIASAISTLNNEVNIKKISKSDPELTEFDSNLFLQERAVHDYLPNIARKFLEDGQNTATFKERVERFKNGFNVKELGGE